MREALAKKKFKIPGEIVKIETIETPSGSVEVAVSIGKTRRSGKEAAKKNIKKYDKARMRGKRFQKLADVNEKKKMEENINIIDEIRNSASKKDTKLTAKKVVEKYKKMRQVMPKKTFLVNEQDIETPDYNAAEPQEDLYIR